MGGPGGGGRRRKRQSGNTPPKKLNKQQKLTDYTDSSKVEKRSKRVEMCSDSEDKSGDKMDSTQSIDTGAAISEIFVKLQKLETLDTISEDISSLKKTVDSLIKSLDHTEETAKQAEEQVKIISHENQSLKMNVTMLKEQNKLIQNQLTDQNNYSRRENIIIAGVNEGRNENILYRVKDLFMQIGCEHLIVQRCHRIGKYETNKTRDIIVRMLHFDDKMLIMSRKMHMPRGVYLNDDFAPETKRNINTLRPVFKEARKNDLKCHMFQDNVIYKGKAYNVHNISQIPINTVKLSEKTSDNAIGFASRYSPLSNLYPQTVEIESNTYNSVEQYFQHQKCMAAGNLSVASAVLMADTPEGAMMAGSAVKMPKEWTHGDGKGIMKQALRTKFSTPHLKDTLKATGKKQIIEATRHPIWGIGLPFHDNDVLIKDKAKGDNQMGLLLMEIRALLE